MALQSLNSYILYAYIFSGSFLINWNFQPENFESAGDCFVSLGLLLEGVSNLDAITFHFKYQIGTFDVHMNAYTFIYSLSLTLPIASIFDVCYPTQIIFNNCHNATVYHYDYYDYYDLWE